MLTLRIKKISPLVYVALGIIIGAILIASVFLPPIIQSHDKLLQNYGVTVSNIAAKQAVDAAFNHDLVRLHVILNELTSLSNIKIATIYDVDNNLMIQSGNPDTTLPSGQTFSSPIALSQSIAGYLSVTFEQTEHNTQALAWFMALLIFALLAASGWLLLHGKALVFNWQIPAKRGASKQTQTNTNLRDASNNADNKEKKLTSSVEGAAIETNTESDGTIAQPNEHGYATITITNLGQLAKQLSPNTLRDTLEHCQSIFSDILALYGGSQIDIQKTGFVLRFDAPNGEQQEPLFRACCSAYLIIHLIKKMQRVPLELSAHIHTDNTNTFSAQTYSDNVLLHCDIYKQTQLKSRLSIISCPNTPDLLCIDSFAQPYQNLLKNQLSQLIKMH